MSTFSFSNLAIKAVAAAVPAYVHTFAPNSRRAARFSKQMGIEQVHISLTEQTSLDLGYVALKDALAHVGWAPDELDLLVFNTQSPDLRGGVGNSHLLHKYFKLKESCAVFDLTVGCAALPYLLSVVGSLACCASDINKIAILSGDTKWMQYQSPEEIKASPVQLSGEGTGVMLLERVSAAPPLKIELYAQGQGYLHLFNLPSLKNSWQRSEDYVLPDGAHWHVGPLDNRNYMNGMAIHEFVTGKICDQLKSYFTQVDPAMFDYFAFHQANGQILSALCTKLGLAPERMLSSLKHYGNTSGASVLVTLSANADKLNDGAHIFSASYGMGLAWGFIEFTLPPHAVLPVSTTELCLTEHQLKPVAPLSAQPTQPTQSAQPAQTAPSALTAQPALSAKAAPL